MRLRWCITAGAAAAIAGCGGGSSTPPPLLHGAPATYLLGIDQLVSPDFVLDSSPHALPAAAVVAAQGGSVADLAAAGFESAATEDFFRSVGSLALANGPVQVDDTVETFGSASGASAAYGRDVARLDARAGSAAVSTGSLGDAAHAVTQTATSADGVSVVEITVEWRVANLLDVLVVRGRDGATRPDDAFILAHRQTSSELGLATPSASAATDA